MKARGEIRVACGSPDLAKALVASLQADDDVQCTTTQEGRTVIIVVEGENAKSLLRAADDVLACMSVAQDVLEGD